jgi:hypothetical protein
VLGHLSLPTDAYGWNLTALSHRLSPDAHPDFTDEALKEVVDALVADGFAEAVNGSVYRLTVKGFEALNAEAPESAGPVVPASIGAATPLGAFDVVANQGEPATVLPDPVATA